MNKYVWNVPRGVRYVSDWEEFRLPQEPHIMDKMITGCGFTEWCITNSENVILCSPRNILLDNKAEQHPEEVFRVRSKYFDREITFDKDLSKDKINPAQVEEDEGDSGPWSTRANEDEEDDVEEIHAIQTRDGLVGISGNEEYTSAYAEISAELEHYMSYMNQLGKPYKILVTYDSFRLLKDIVNNMPGVGIEMFQIVIDEFQSIFTDSRFKADTELKFMVELRDLERVCFLSATPMIEDYLRVVPDFKELPYYQLDWKAEDPGRVMKPKLLIRSASRSIYDPAKREIEIYKSGQFPVAYRKDDETGEVVVIESRELVIYLNSVHNILHIIKRCGLKPEEVNILCADTPKNRKQIRKELKGKFSIGKVPLKGEPRKMFTFCTRTVYLGADFYSPCARTLILSDANIDCLAVDISLDLPQIMGRQRLTENPWKDSADFYYKPLVKGGGKISKAEFDAKVVAKRMNTEKVIKQFGGLAATGQEDDELMRLLEDYTKIGYKKYYLGIGVKNGKKVPELNWLVLTSEQRAYDIQQTDYADRFNIFDETGQTADGIEGELNTFFLGYDELKTTPEKLRFLCEANISDEAREIIEKRIDTDIISYLALGKDRLKVLGYHTTRIKKELNSVVTVSNDEFLATIYSEFKVDDKLTKADIKSRLSQIYEKFRMKKKAKATDLSEWFELQEVNITLSDKTRTKGFQIIRKL